MTLLEVPPGHVPTRITPAKSPASSPKIFPKEKVKTGITVNCARQPIKTSFSCVKTTLKSSSFMVSPIPNITTIKRELTALSEIQRPLDGTKRASAATARTINAINRLKKWAIVFMPIHITFYGYM